jgi:hypothetical protein
VAISRPLLLREKMLGKIPCQPAKITGQSGREVSNLLSIQHVLYKKFINVGIKEITTFFVFFSYAKYLI